MESEIRNFFDKINGLEDLQEYVTDSEDGESSWLEFKALQKGGKKWGKREFENHIKSLAAKEICAFLNTNDGILCLGVDCTDKKLSIINEYDGDLYSFMSRNIKDILEPAPSGVSLKKVGDDGRVALLIFAPRSDLMPHRVWGKAESGIACNYFTRSDTDSVKLSEGLVRALYLSHGRMPRIRLYTEVEMISSNQILLRVLAKPDKTEFIDSYYDSERFLMLDGGGKPIITEDNNDMWVSIGSLGKRFGSPIYPANELIQLGVHDITNDYSNDSAFPVGLAATEEQYSILADNTHLSITDFASMQYIITESSFACSNASLMRSRRLYVLPLGLGRDEDRFRFRGMCGLRNAKFEALEEKYEMDVFVSECFNNDKILYDAKETAIIMPMGDKISVGFIDNFLKDLDFIKRKNDGDCEWLA